MTGRRRAAVAALAALLLTSGCADIPTSSRPEVIGESVPASAAPDGDLRYDEIVPRPGEAPVDIVRDYLRAGGSFERAHARARAYLTPTGTEAWKDAAGAFIIEDSPYLNVSNNGATVQMIARQRGRLLADGSYLPGEARFPYEFRLRQVNGNWRIDNPPDGLLLEAGTFGAAYRPYEVYFLDGTRRRVVPDVRYYAASRDALPSILAAAIEDGPSAALAGAVLSDLDGVTLQNNVEQEQGRVKVYLTGLDDEADTLSDGGFAQLVWTLNQVGVGGIEVYVDNRLVQPTSAPQRSLQTIADWRTFNPDGLSVSAPGYFIRDGAVWTTEDVPIAGPAGRRAFGAVSVGVSLDERYLAVVRRANGRDTLFVGPPNGLRATPITGSLSAPTWGAEDREVWTVRNGSAVIIVPTEGPQALVDVAAAAVLGEIRSLRLSRDGARVALVAGSADNARVWVGAVFRDGARARIAGLRALDLGATPAVDVSWENSLTLVGRARVGERDSDLFSLYRVEINGVSAGRLVDAAGLPGPPFAVAAGPSLPLLTIAAGALWRTPSSAEPWTRVTARGAGESAPTYPG